MAKTKEEFAALEKAMQDKQLKTPTHPLSQRPSPLALGEGRSPYGVIIDDMIKYLRDNNWTPAGVDGRGLPKWNDPTLGSVKSRVEKIDTGGKDRESKEPIIVKQLVVPVGPWDYTLEEAVQIQQDRDSKANKKSA